VKGSSGGWCAVSFLWVIFLLMSGCGSAPSTKPGVSVGEFSAAAKEFTRALCAREYDRAYEMTSARFRQGSDRDKLKTDFEAIVPLDWGETDPLEVTQTLTSWPSKRASDVGWAYVGISGETYSEGLTIVIELENHALRVAEVEFGRP
jgi:hypothetical protein